jgi:hypothetical protein
MLPLNARRLVSILCLVAALCIAVAALVNHELYSRTPQAKLDQQEHGWQKKRPRHYSYVVTFAGSSVRSFFGPVKFEVRDNSAVRTTPLSSLGDFTAGEFNDVATMDKVFAFVRTTMQHRHDRVELDFDQTWGFPVRAMMSENIQEGDTEFRVSQFHALP